MYYYPFLYVTIIRSFSYYHYTISDHIIIIFMIINCFIMPPLTHNDIVMIYYDVEIEKAPIK